MILNKLIQFWTMTSILIPLAVEHCIPKLSIDSVLVCREHSMDVTHRTKIRLQYQFICRLLCRFLATMSIFLLYDTNRRWVTVRQSGHIFNAGSNWCRTLRNISLYTTVIQSNLYTNILFYIASRDAIGFGTEKIISAYLDPDRIREKIYNLEVF